MELNIKKSRWPLSGVPGRAGADGTPGKDGKDGMSGIDGKNGKFFSLDPIKRKSFTECWVFDYAGKDGRDGAVGPIGLQGPMGVQGPRGTNDYCGNYVLRPKHQIKSTLCCEHKLELCETQFQPFLCRITNPFRFQITLKMRCRLKSLFSIIPGLTC